MTAYNVVRMRVKPGRQDMLKELDGIRELLEDLGNGLGVTDPVSGEAVVEIA